MIVKNEERYLPDCLASAAPYVDEIVVVDTGSIDSTVKIAESFGARVHPFAWINDFAAARNESLKHAAGDWILQLDADERLCLLGCPTALRDAVGGSGGVDAYAVMIRSQCPGQDATTYASNHSLRFFRRLPGIRYEGMVHESVEPFMVRSGGSIAHARFMIDHVGYGIDASEFVLKLRRNLEILKLAEAREPSNAYVLFCLGTTFAALGQKDEALRVLERGLSRPGVSDLLQAMTLNSMTRIYFVSTEYDESIKSAKKSLKILPNQNTARFFLGAAYYAQDKYAEAIPHLLSCYEYSRQPMIERVTELSQEYTINEVSLLNKIAISYLQVNKYELALYYMNKSIANGANYQLLAHFIVFVYFKTGKIKEAIEHFAALNDIDPDLSNKSFGLIVSIIQESNDSSYIESLLDAKSRLIELGSFDQVGRVLSSLAQPGYINAMKILFRVCRDRDRELEALLLGVINYLDTRNRLSELLAAISELVEEYPTHVGFLHACGIIHIKQGNYFRAMETYRRIHALMPGNARARRMLAGLHASVGNEAQALHLIGAVQIQ
jgi:glycosyltransferase involved in cell wall biosynthesis